MMLNDNIIVKKNSIKHEIRGSELIGWKNYEIFWNPDNALYKKDIITSV